MLNLFTRFAFLVSMLFLFATQTKANDSDVVNCNKSWTIVVLGSSTSFGTGATPSDSSWVSKFTEYVKRKNVLNTVYNFGIPGFTTYNNLCPTGFTPPANRPSPVNGFNITAALALQPDAIIINMPSNDAVNDYSIAEQQENFERTMHLADSANVAVWVTTTQPRNNLTSQQNTDIQTMRDWIITRFGNKAVDFYSTVANPDGSIAIAYDYDAVHVNNLGHDLFYNRIKAETVLDSLCNRFTQQALVARAGNDISITLPTNTISLDGSTSSALNGSITSYTWAKISGPNNFQIVSPNTATTNVNNLTEGRYSFSLTVTDNNSNIKADTVDVIVSSRILFEVGPDITTSPDGGGKYWNTFTNGLPGIKIQNAVTIANAATTVTLEVINRIDGTFNVNGPGTNTGNTVGAVNDYPATATSDYAFAEPSAVNGSWKISGLDALKQYTVKFWGTRSVADQRVIEIKRSDASVWQEYDASNNSDYNRAAIFTFSGKTEMTFDIRVKSGSAFGHISVVDISVTTASNAVNLPPVARAGNDINTSLPVSTANLNGSASTDEDGVISSYEWIKISGPESYTIVSANAATTAVNDLVEGIYTFVLKVTDDKAAFSTDTVKVTVSTRILFDAGLDATASPDTDGKYWNNVTDGLPGIKVQNALTTGNVATTVTLEVINRIDGTFNTGGPGASTGNVGGAVNDYPVSATTDYIFAHPSATDGRWKFSGLDNSKQYTIKFWGTRSVADDRIIEIKRADELTWKEYNATNNADYNRAAVFTITGQTEMIFDIRVKDGSAFGHISVVDINVTNPILVCAPAVIISANPSTPICSGSPVTFTAVPTNGGTAPTYQWKKNGVNINGATGSTYSTTTSINNDNITCVLTSNFVCIGSNVTTSNVITMSVIPIAAKPGNISGPTDICSFVGTVNTATYSIAPVNNATTYIWSVPVGAAIISGQGTTSINVLFDNTVSSVDTIKVSSGPCTNSAPSKLTVSKILPAIPGAITGPTNACPFIGQATNAVYSIVAVPNAVSYIWTVPAGATIISGQGTTSIEVSYLNAFVSGSIKVTANGNCGSRAPRSLTISKLLPGTPTVISGPANACAFVGTGTQVNYSIAAVNNATSYLWTVPANVSIVSGQGTNSIIVTFNAGYITAALKVRSVANCGNSSDRSLSVTASAPSTPGAITGSTNACQFIGSTEEAVYTIRKVSNALSYVWTVPTGATITSHPGGTGLNDTIITVSFDNNFVSTTNISVQSAGCGTSNARNLSILRSTLPSTPGTISGLTNPCAIVGTLNTATYTISKVAYASSYNWVLPAGATATHPAGTGFNDTIIQVTYGAGFSSGTIAVTSANGCGTNNIARTLAIKTLAPTTTPTIVGPTDPCPWIGTTGATYTIKKIANATGYTWTTPAVGAIVTHPNPPGVNDTIIIVNYTTAFTTGAITVRADANCGSTSVRTLTLVRKLPSVPGAITGQSLSACPVRQFIYSIPALPTNATTVTWSVPAGASIDAGQGTTNILVTYPASAISGLVSVVGTNGCGNGTSVRSLNVNLPVCTELPRIVTAPSGKSNATAKTFTELTVTHELEVNAMPNPSQGQFTLTVNSNERSIPVSLRITDLNGKMIEIRQGIMPGQTVKLGSNYIKGLYIAEFVQGNKHKLIKLIKL
ncbi:MAG TPA: GDSL-type esterase/lipase family protein [Ferruginibacter sp.]|nr:GDSL-type esterase/lipase family protein [Ferruginibacter sp.]